MELPMPTAPIASAPRRPTMRTSTMPIVTQPSSARTTGTASASIGLNSPRNRFNEKGKGKKLLTAEPARVHLHEPAQFLDRFGAVVHLETQHDVIVQPDAAVLF